MRDGIGWDGVMTHARAHKDKHPRTSTQERATRMASQQQGTSTQRATQRKLDGIICILYGAGQKRHKRTERTEGKRKTRKTSFIFSKKQGSLVTPKGIKPHHHVKVIP